MEIKISLTKIFQHSFTQGEFDRFAVLSGDNNPIHVDPDFAAQTRFGRTVAHGMLLYSTLSGFLGTQFPGPGTIQIEQEMTFCSPIFVGEQVKFEIQVTHTYPDSGLIDLKTCAVRPNKEFGLKGRTLVKIAEKSQNLDWQPAPMVQIEGMQAESFKGLQVGQSAELQRIFSRNDLAEYTSVSGDTNPIFTDLDYARSVDFDDNPLPGGLLGGMFSCLLGTQLPGRGTNWLKQSMYYPTPAYLNEMITARVEIIRLRPEKDLVNLRTLCINPLGDVVCEGEALVYVEDLEGQNDP